MRPTFRWSRGCKRLAVSLFCLCSSTASARLPGPRHGFTCPQATSSVSCDLVTVWSRTPAESTCPCMPPQRSAPAAGMLRCKLDRPAFLQQQCCRPNPRSSTLPGGASGLARGQATTTSAGGQGSRWSLSSKWSIGMHVCLSAATWCLSRKSASRCSLPPQAANGWHIPPAAAW